MQLKSVRRTWLEEMFDYKQVGRGALHNRTERGDVMNYAAWNRAAVRSRALAASVSRSRGGALVTSESSSSRAASATCSTARLKTSSFAFEGFEKPLSFRTNCSDDARISSSVAGGLKL